MKMRLPVNLADIDFSKCGGTSIWFQSQVDLDWIKPGTENDDKPMELAAAKEDTEGEVVNVNWDDDDNSEGDGGHGILVFKNDYDDSAANPNEDDMIKLKLRSIGVGYKARLKYDNSFMKIWRNDDRTNEVVSEETEIELAGDQTVYLEGKKLTAAETPQVIEMQIKLGSGSYVAGDCVNLQVATPVVTLFSKHLPTEGNGSRNLAKQLHRKNYLGARRRDDRNNTVILKGKDQQDKVLWYSIDMFDLFDSFEGDIDKRRPKITVRSPHLDKELKMALSLEGAHVYCNGHSNFGLGPNFIPNDTSTTTLYDYCNLSGGPLGGVTGIILKSDDPRDADFGGNPMLNPDHGGEDFALRPQDIVPQVTNYKVPVPNVLKFNGTQVNGAVLAVGSILTPQPPLADGTIYHYEQNGEHQNYVTVVKSSGDKPILRYKSCFMAGCNTGRAFSQTLNHGVLIYTMDESYAVTGGADAQIDNDYPSDDYSWDITHHVRLLTEGKTWQEIVTFLNQNQYFKAPRTSPETPDNFKFKTY